MALRQARMPMRRVIDLQGMPELAGIAGLQDGGFRLGVLVTMSAMLREPTL